MGRNTLMHKDEIEVNETMVRNLISQQFPVYQDADIRKVNSTGTVNAIYRLGEELYVRLPRLHWANESLHKEWTVLSMISKQTSLEIPEVIEKGRPGAGYPLDWAICRWIPGMPYEQPLADEMETAEALAQFINELRSIQVIEGAPKAGRKPLMELHEATVNAIGECAEDLDSKKALRIWNDLVHTEPWSGNPVWIHADLLKPNMLVRDGRLSAVIDFGSAGIGDPAFDLIAAWTVLTSESRDVFRSLVGTDDQAWQRAKAYALHQAVLIIPYYRESNPVFTEHAKNTMSNILSDD